MNEILTPEMIEKAKAAKSAEELLSLAKENEIELTNEQANAYFERLSKRGEVSDDDLSNVAGGGCTIDTNRKIVMPDDVCDNWKCKSCGGTLKKLWGSLTPKCKCGAADMANCGSCKHMSRESVICYCNSSLNFGQ